MNRNPYASLIMASLALQCVTTAMFAAAIGGLFYKLRREPFASATHALTALGLISLLWWIAMVIRAEASTMGFVLTATMAGSILTFGVYLLRTVGALERSDPQFMSTPRTVRSLPPVFVIGSGVGMLGHYWSYYLAAPDNVVRYLWLRALLLLALVVAGMRCIAALHRPSAASGRIGFLLSGVVGATMCLVIDGALRLALSAGESGPWIAATSVFSAFFGPFVLGVALLIATLDMQREQLCRSSEQVQRSLKSALERERLMGVGRVAEGLANDIQARFHRIQMDLLRLRTHSLRGSETAEELDQVQMAIVRAQSLTARLKSIARLRPVRSEQIAVLAFVRQSVHGLRAAIPEHVLLSVGGSSSSVIRGDPDRLNQLISNFVLNARDAVAVNGKIEVEVEDSNVQVIPITTRGSLVPGPYVTISVRDDGSGIPANLIDSIFEPFVSTKGESGTGLGLATVATVVHEFRGALRVTSERGRGTCFVVWLPSDGHLATLSPAENHRAVSSIG